MYRTLDLVNKYSPALVAGWGEDTEIDKPTTILQYACVDIITQRKCKDCAFQTITDSMICANGSTTDAGPGDSGGGLMFYNADSDKLILGGVVSGRLQALTECGRVALYMRFTKSVLEWIDSKILSS